MGHSLTTLRIQTYNKVKSHRLPSTEFSHLGSIAVSHFAGLVFSSNSAKCKTALGIRLQIILLGLLSQSMIGFHTNSKVGSKTD